MMAAPRRTDANGRAPARRAARPSAPSVITLASVALATLLGVCLAEGTLSMFTAVNAAQLAGAW